MNEYINSLEENIIKSTQDIDSIIESLKGIKGNLLSVGSGGSKVVALYASFVLSKKNQILTRTIDPRDMNYINKDLYENIFMSSYSGSNFGVINSFNNDLKKYLLTNRESKITDEELLHYDMCKEHSFISLNATLVPMAILLKYYYGCNFNKLIEDMFMQVDKDKNLELNGEYTNIFSGIDTETSQEFISSTLTEAGISSPLIHEKYGYCHGRSTINKDKKYSAIYLGYNGSELDINLKEIMEEQNSNLCILDKIYDDEVVNDFYLTLQSIYLLRNIAEDKGINLSKIDYDKEATKKLYYFKGSM